MKQATRTDPRRGPLSWMKREGAEPSIRHCQSLPRRYCSDRQMVFSQLIFKCYTMTYPFRQDSGPSTVLAVYQEA
jgi:hypothetical protein